MTNDARDSLNSAGSVLQKSGLTMWRRLDYFEGDYQTLADSLVLIIADLQSNSVLTSDYRKGVADVLSRILKKPSVIRSGPRGKPSARRADDVALYFYARKQLEGQGNYAAALNLTEKAWQLPDKTIKEYDRLSGGDAVDRLNDLRSYSVYTRKLPIERLFELLLLDILDDHTSPRCDGWRLEFLRAKDAELSYETSKVAELNRVDIQQEIQLIQRLHLNRP